MKRIVYVCIYLFLVAACTPASNELQQWQAPIDKLVVKKSKRKLHLLSKDKIIKTYRGSLGKNPLGHKIQEGDGKTPEGTYIIDRRNVNSAYHRSLHISYPSPEDIKRAKITGIPPGGDIMIHGLPNGLGFLAPVHHLMDWTKGCIAVTDKEIEEIWNHVPDGTQIIIKP